MVRPVQLVPRVCPVQMVALGRLVHQVHPVVLVRLVRLVSGNQAHVVKLVNQVFLANRAPRVTPVRWASVVISALRSVLIVFYHNLNRKHRVSLVAMASKVHQALLVSQVDVVKLVP